MLTYHNDPGRTGQALEETTLTPGNVNPSAFGKVFTDPVDGYVYAQPLAVSDVAIPGGGTKDLVIVATEHDSVYAFDADRGGAPVWHASFLDTAAGVTTVPATQDHQLDLYPEVGITSTPVIDRGTETAYVVAETSEKSGTTTKDVLRLHALDLGTGAEKFGGPMVIAASVRGRGAGQVRGKVAFLPDVQIQRPALLLSGGLVYSAYASLGDHGAYHGWVIASDARTLRTVAAFNATPNGTEGGIWMSGAGPAADPEGDVYAMTGNGTFTAPAGGKDYGDSVVKLDGTTLRVSDYFTPANQRRLKARDLDLGSGGVLLVPEQPGRSPHLLVGGGKDGTAYVLNRDHLGHVGARGKASAQAIPNPGHAVFSTPAYFRGKVYLHAVGDVLKAYRVSDGTLVGPVAKSSTTFNYPGATPSISANGTSDGIVWEIQNTGKRGSPGPAVLNAFDAEDISRKLYSADQAGARDEAGPYVKFSVPTIFRGRVYVGTQTGLVAYGLLG